MKRLPLQDNSVERAADWIFSHVDELDQPMETDGGGQAAPAGPECRDGSESESLFIFASHAP